ncbi:MULTISPECIES: phosphopantetheine-binding protein [unclassified Streptomyces]|uniref:phosphopantetheine-binding protein n=1 Tax=unclassified Streptomyces TaxID=2593676 RepID=UPI0035E3A3F5
MVDTAGQQAFTRERLTRDVADVLYVDPSEVEPAESLIEQGLDSIRLMTLVEGWRAEGAEVGFVELAEHPTLDAWVELLNTSTGATRARR